MTEATPRPWDVEFAATKSYDLIYSGSRMDGTTIARVPWTGKSEDRANTELILKAVNSHDVLVAALEAVQWDIAGTCASCGCDSTETHKTDCQLAAALEQVK